MDKILPGERYGQRYESILVDTLKEIEKEILKIVKDMEAGDFSQRDRIQYLTANKLQIEGYITKNYNAAYKQSIGGADREILKRSDSVMKDAGIETVPFKETDLDIFKSMRQNTSVWFETNGKLAARGVFDSMTKWALTGDKKILNTFLDQMSEEKVAKYGKVIVENHITAMYRTFNAVRANNAGVKRYLYVGPLPKREFCQNAYGKTFYYDEILRMNNGQTGNVFTDCGGYNCRHDWEPVPPTEEDDNYKPEKEKKVIKDLTNQGLISDKKSKVLIKDSKGNSIGLIQRAFKEDEKGTYYKRFTGDKEYLKFDAAGNAYIIGKGR